MILAAAVPIASLLIWLGLPSSWCDAHRRGVREAVTWLVGFQAIAAVLTGISLLMLPGSLREFRLFGFGSNGLAEVTIRLDAVSMLMLILVSFIGWVICRYSVRYLDGEPTQGRYYRWTAFTIGAVSTMVVSGNLLMLFVAWVMTSSGLHALLLYYPHRPAARRAAWTKFLISRLGDVALIAAIVLVYHTFGTFHLSSIFATLQGDRSGLEAGWLTWIGSLLVFGAVTKSAQFPLHTWLPQTMETPTPVSALMHAGIVNAGGYLIIRTAPLVAESPGAMNALAIIGAFTACFAAIVMLTQTSIKQALAYSTVAQMGFMMLQCGLGSYSAALLHLLAHSLYKAHAFLSSGSVMTQRQQTAGVGWNGKSASPSALQWLLAAGYSVAVFAVLAGVVGIELSRKPGGWLLGGILCLAMTHWLGGVLASQHRKMPVTALGIVAGLLLSYLVMFRLIDTAIASVASMPAARITPLAVSLIVAALFLFVFLTQWTLARGTKPRWLRAAYVHASNGFYIEPLFRRLISPVVSS